MAAEVAAIIHFMPAVMTGITSLFNAIAVCEDLVSGSDRMWALSKLVGFIVALMSTIESKRISLRFFLDAADRTAILSAEQLGWELLREIESMLRPCRNFMAKIDKTKKRRFTGFFNNAVWKMRFEGKYQRLDGHYTRSYQILSNTNVLLDRISDKVAVGDPHPDATNRSL